MEVQQGESVHNLFPFLPFCNTNLYIWCWIAGALVKQNESQGCFKPSYVRGPPYGIRLGKVDAVRTGPKEIKSQTRTIIDKISNKKHHGNFQHTVWHTIHISKKKLIMSE